MNYFQEVIAEFGASIVGVVILHCGRSVTLSGRAGQWEAWTLAEPESVEEHDVPGFGATVREALDACVREAELVEAQDGEECPDDEEDDDEG